MLPRNGFFDIDDILATQQKIPCVSLAKIPQMGRQFGSPGTNVECGSKIEIPGWLTAVLNNRQRSLIRVDVPKQFQQKYRDIVEADAEVVDLHKLGPYYYDVGRHLITLTPDNVDQISTTIVQTFTMRFRSLMDGCLHATDESRNRRLDKTELQLYKFGQSASRDFDLWQRCGKQKLTATDMVANHRKRKLHQMEGTTTLI